MVQHGFGPEHLGQGFIELYSMILSDRLKSKSLRHDESLSKEDRAFHSLRNDLYKLALNGMFNLEINVFRHNFKIKSYEYKKQRGLHDYQYV